MDAEKAREDIAFIRKMMEDSKRVVVDTGLHFLSWGSLSIMGSIASFVVAQLGYMQAIPWLWVGIYLAGGVLTVLIVVKTVRGRPKTLAGRLLGRVWGGMAIFGGLGIAAFFAGRIDLPLSLAMVAALLGLAIFISSLVLERKSFLYLSFAWWAGAIVVAVLPGYWPVLAFEVLVLFFQVIPGIAVYRTWRKQTGGETAAQ